MKTADLLMKKKSFLKTEMDKVMPKDQSDVMWRASTERLQSILAQYNDLPAGVQSHTDSIFPAAAVYMTVKGKYDDKIAYKIWG